MKPFADACSAPLRCGEGFFSSRALLRARRHFFQRKRLLMCRAYHPRSPEICCSRARRARSQTSVLLGTAGVLGATLHNSIPRVPRPFAQVRRHARRSSRPLRTRALRLGERRDAPHPCPAACSSPCAALPVRRAAVEALFQILDRNLLTETKVSVVDWRSPLRSGFCVFEAPRTAPCGILPRR